MAGVGVEGGDATTAGVEIRATGAGVSVWAATGVATGGITTATGAGVVTAGIVAAGVEAAGAGVGGGVVALATGAATGPGLSHGRHSKSTATIPRRPTIVAKTGPVLLFAGNAFPTLLLDVGAERLDADWVPAGATYIDMAATDSADGCSKRSLAQTNCCTSAS